MARSKFLATIGVAAAVSLGLAACSGGGGSDGEDVAAADSGEVAWWGWTPDTPVAEGYIKAFNQEYPDITVTYRNFENVDFRTAIVPALDSGEGPDVFDVSPAGGSPDTYGGYAVDLAPLAEEELGADWASKFGKGYTDQLTNSDGRLVALPLGGLSAGFIWYNAEILQQAGTEMPTDYDSWVATCDAIAAIGKSCFTMGAGGEDTFPTEMYHSIANSVDPDFFIAAAKGEASWDDPEGVQVLRIIQDMRDDGIIAPNALDAPQYPLANEEFMRGDAAMVQMGSWYTQYAGAESCQAAMEAAGVSNPTCFTQLPAPFPDVAGAGNGSEYFSEADYGLSISRDSPNIAAAKTFVAWMTTTQEGVQTVVNAIDVLPALQGVTPQWDSIELVNPEVQRPAIEELFADSAEATQSRQLLTSEATLDAMVVAIQQVLDPTANRPLEEIAAEQQANSEPSDLDVD